MKRYHIRPLFSAPITPFEKRTQNGSGGQIGAHYSLLDLGAIVRAAATAKSFFWKFVSADEILIFPTSTYRYITNLLLHYILQFLPELTSTDKKLSS